MSGKGASAGDHGDAGLYAAAPAGILNTWSAEVEMTQESKGVIMNKEEIYEYLKSRGIWHEITEHKAVYNMEELSDVALPYPEADAKNLFVRDDKKRNYYLITVKGDRRVDLNEFRQKNQTRRLSFASEQDLMNILSLIPGAVTPFGLLNDETCRVQFFLDETFTDAPGLIGVHPNENTATVWMKTEDLLHVIEQHGNAVCIVKF